MKKIAVCFLSVAMLICVLSGCTDKNPLYSYSYERNSENNMIKFLSSDSGLDSFLNEYLERHMRYNEKTEIHNCRIGDGGTTWKEWEAMSTMFWAADTNTLEIYGARSKIRRWIEGIYQDKQGYIWMDEGYGEEQWGNGWEFPSYKDSAGQAVGFEFDSSYENWTVSSAVNVYSGNGGIGGSGENIPEVVYESPDFKASAFHSPFIAFGTQYYNYNDSDDELKDIYVSFQTESEPYYSEDKTVSYTQFATNSAPISKYIKERVYFPMYLHEKWGTSETNNITKIKITYKANTFMHANTALSYVRLNYDTRHSNNQTMLITALQKYFEFTQDLDFLKENIVKARKAMQFMLTELNGNQGLVDVSYFVGHDGIRGSGHGIGDGYWDILALPSKNLYTNTYFYRAVNAMEYLERICAENKISTEDAVITDSDMKGTVTYKETESTLSSLKTLIKTKMSEEFWDTSTGRMHAGINAKGEKIDYGYIVFNLEAVASGICTEEQEKSIMSWVSGERIIDGDTSTGKDIYKFEFTPRTTTKRNSRQYYWGWGGATYGAQVQDGGAVMQLSYYDLISRIRTSGSDDAFTRLKAIQKWYEKVKAAGGQGWNFYRKYYDRFDLILQGGGTSGGIGLDHEFLEATLMFASVPDGFFGIKSQSTGVLTVDPNFPSSLDYWKMENLTYGNYFYDLSVGTHFVQIDGIRIVYDDDTYTVKNPYLQAVLDVPSFKYKVLVNGTATSDYTVTNGKITVKVPFANCKVEIAKK